MIAAIIALTALATVFGLVLGFAAVRFKVEGDPLVDQIDKILPQTQCGQCNYPGCRPYAEAIAGGDADINQCPPGGEDGLINLARRAWQAVTADTPQRLDELLIMWRHVCQLFDTIRDTPG